MMVWPGWSATNTSGRESTWGLYALKQKYHLPSKCAVFCAIFFKKKVFLLSKKDLKKFTSNLLSFTTFYSVLPRLVLSFTKYPMLPSRLSYCAHSQTYSDFRAAEFQELLNGIGEQTSYPQMTPEHVRRVRTVWCAEHAICSVQRTECGTMCSAQRVQCAAYAMCSLLNAQRPNAKRTMRNVQSMYSALNQQPSIYTCLVLLAFCQGVGTNRIFFLEHILSNMPLRLVRTSHCSCPAWSLNASSPPPQGASSFATTGFGCSARTIFAK